MLLKLSRQLAHLPAFCCRSSTFQAKRLNPMCSRYVTKSPFISTNFIRNYSVKNEKKVNEYWIGSKPGDGKIRGRAATNLQESFVTDFIVSNEEATDEDWNKLREKLLQVELGNLKELNIDAKILDSCCTYNNFSLARNYLKYMRNTGKKYNSSTVCSFIKICYANKRLCTKDDLAKVDQFTKYLQVRYKVFDQIVGECIVKGYCLRNDWQKCATIIEEISQYIEPNFNTVSAYATCLIENNEIDKAWAVMTSTSGRKFTPKNEVFIAWIEKTKSNPDQIELLLKFFQLSNVIPEKSVCDYLVSIYSDFPPEKRLNASFVSIDNTGKCPNCGEKLHRVNINEEEFNILRDEFLNRVLIRDDIFKNTNPKELKNFFQIVKRNAPFDIVIDGLNVMYMSGTKKSEHVYSQLLTETVRHFVDRGQKVLVIGRKHMYNFAKESLSYVRANSTLFLISDVSEDDPYMIYATFYSGPDSCFVTRDLMRSEKYKLSNDELALLFKRWQQSHQIFIEHVNYQTGRVFFKNPITFEMATQASKHGWHVPYHLETFTGTDDYGMHEHWLCLKK